MTVFRAVPRLLKRGGVLPGPPFLPIMNGDEVVEMKGQVEVVVENEEDEGGVVEMKGEVEVVVENEVDEDGVVEMKGEIYIEVVVENVRVTSEGDVDEIQKRDNTDKVGRIIQEIVTHLLE